MHLHHLLFFTIASSSVTHTTSATILPLHRRSPQPQSQSQSQSNQSNPAPHGTTFDVEVQFGTNNQSFQLQVDTGSSDTWVVGTGYRCFDDKNVNTVLPQKECRYAADKTYDVSSSTSFQRIQNRTFGAQYDGTGTGIATGIMGYEDVTIGGVTVRRQTVGVVDRTTKKGDGINSGILGLGYPVLTAAHAGGTDIEGIDTDTDNGTLLLNDRIQYDPLFTSMYKQGLVKEPWFSLAIERPSASNNTSTSTSTTAGPPGGGYLGLATLPPIPHDSTKWAKAPVEITSSIPPSWTNGTRQITLWTLSVEAVTWGNFTTANNHSNNSTLSSMANSTRFQAVVDSGNAFNVLPPEIVMQVHESFDPPATPTFDPVIGGYGVNCTADPPTLGIQIDGQMFYHRGEDLVIRNPDGTCMSSLLPTGGGGPEEGVVALNFLGDPFLRNVVAVFDFGKDEMRFAARDDGGNSASTTGSSSASSVGGPGSLVAVPVMLIVVMMTIS
ncbi:hypothetical protein VTN00DRAFT_3596 [Thermoascus crustaceus]|uniref:uncharacterized protein n=1 Tax=Thermoascus crustaceus TaxID=5088 RepID=UPI0037435F59